MRSGTEDTGEQIPAKKGFFASYMPENTWGTALLGAVVIGVGLLTGGTGVPAVIALWGAYKGYKNAKDARPPKNGLVGLIKGSFLGLAVSLVSAAVSVVSAVAGPVIAAVGTAIAIAGYGNKQYKENKAREGQEQRSDIEMQLPRAQDQGRQHAQHQEQQHVQGQKQQHVQQAEDVEYEYEGGRLTGASAMNNKRAGGQRRGSTGGIGQQSRQEGHQPTQHGQFKTPNSNPRPNPNLPPNSRGRANSLWE